MRLTGFAATFLVTVCLLRPSVLHAQCDQAASGSVTIFLFDLKSPDIPQEKLNKFLDVLTFKLNSGIRQHLQSRGLLGKTTFNVRWCSGYPVQQQDAAVRNGRMLNSTGVMWGFLDQSTGQLRSATHLTSLAEDPISDLKNIVYDGGDRDLVDEAYVAFASYILGKIHLQNRDMVLARRCFSHAKELRALPELLLKDMNETLAELNQQSVASKLTPLGKRSR